MTRLFIRFYAGVLIVLFLAWYIHGWVAEERTLADRAHVISTAHAGGARLIVGQLDAAKTDAKREQMLERIDGQFDYPIEIAKRATLSPAELRQLNGGSDVIFSKNSIIAKLEDPKFVLKMGPFPSYRLDEIENSIAGWMRLTKHQVDESVDRSAVLDALNQQSEVDIKVVAVAELPSKTQHKLSKAPHVISFFVLADEMGYAAIQLADGKSALQFGPFPRFDNIEQQAATTTLALVLLPAAIAIAFLLRPVAQQLRQLENAAKAIASGDLTARVDESQMNSAQPLAHAFNHMAGRTESLVRTQRELLQAVSHELRTPLSRMRFAIDLIESASSDEERSQRLASLDAATTELDELVGELLRYVRLETAQPEVEPEVVQLSQALDVVVPKFSTIYADIEFNAGQSTRAADAVVWADRRGFQRAIGNLVSNAGKFAERTVNVEAQVINGTIVIDVDDDGPGIPEQERLRVFEPFVRLEAKDNRHGVGLGLALVKRIASQNNCSIEVLKSPLGGCRVRTTWQRSAKE